MNHRARTASGGQGDGGGDALAGHFGVGAAGRGLGEQRGGLGVVGSGPGHDEVGAGLVAAVCGVAAEGDGRLDRDRLRVEAVLTGQEAEGAVEAGGIPSGEELLGVRARDEGTPVMDGARVATCRGSARSTLR